MQKFAKRPFFTAQSLACRSRLRLRIIILSIIICKYCDLVLSYKKRNKDEFMDVINFLDKSYTAYHAVKHSEYILEKHGFSELNLADKWNLEVGGKYYVVKNGTSVIAFVVGENFAFNIAASHTDSPCLHVKGRDLLSSPEGARLNVEAYGGLILYSMLDAPLKVAGRIIEKHGDMLTSKIVESDYNVIIPSLAIHHNPNVNSAFSVSVQKDMLPLVGDADDFYSTLSKEEIVDADLYVVPATSPFRSGANGEYLCSPRIDNLTSVYATLAALVIANPQNVAICACFDNEEIGSRTKQGANSSLMQTVLEKSRAGSAKPKTIIYPLARRASFFPLTTHTRFTRPSPKNGRQRACVYGQRHCRQTSRQLCDGRRILCDFQDHTR